MLSLSDLYGLDLSSRFIALDVSSKFGYSKLSKEDPWETYCIMQDCMFKGICLAMVFGVDWLIRNLLEVRVLPTSFDRATTFPVHGANRLWECRLVIVIRRHIFRFSNDKRGWIHYSFNRWFLPCQCSWLIDIPLDGLLGTLFLGALWSAVA